MHAKDRLMRWTILSEYSSTSRKLQRLSAQLPLIEKACRFKGRGTDDLRVHQNVKLYSVRQIRKLLRFFR